MIEAILVVLSLYFALTNQLLVATYIIVMTIYLKILVRDLMKMKED